MFKLGVADHVWTLAEIAGLLGQLETPHIEAVDSHRADVWIHSPAGSSSGRFASLWAVHQDGTVDGPLGGSRHDVASRSFRFIAALASLSISPATASTSSTDRQSWTSDPLPSLPSTRTSGVE